MVDLEQRARFSCPKCGANERLRERRLNGNSRCVNGHTYPSRDAVDHSAHRGTAAPALRQQPAAVVDEAMVDRYLAAQAKAMQEIDNKWGNGGKAPSYVHPVREACRAGLTAALAGGAK